MASEHLAKEHQIEIIHEEDDDGDVEEEMRSTTALPRKRGRPRSQGNKGTKLMRKNNHNAMMVRTCLLEKEETKFIG